MATPCTGKKGSGRPTSWAVITCCGLGKGVRPAVVAVEAAAAGSILAGRKGGIGLLAIAWGSGLLWHAVSSSNGSSRIGRS